MADRVDMLALTFLRPAAARSSAFALLWAAALGVSAAPPPPPSQAPPARAHIVEVTPAFLNQGSASIPGAGVRSFQDSEPESSGTERFEIRWYANPPGLPPGAILLLETVPERSAVVKNHVLRTSARSEGYIRSVIEIPSTEVRRAGRAVKWRVRIVWRGRLLASRASGNWER